MFSALRRAAVLVLVVTLSSAALMVSGAAVADDGPQVDYRAYNDAYAWLSRNLPMDQLVDGDEELTWAAAAVFPQSQLGDIARAHYDEYLGDPATVRTAHLADAIAMGQSMGRDVTALVDELTSRIATTGPATGRFADRAPGPAYVDTADQAAATTVLALEKSPAAAAARTFLLHQQCVDGGFRPEPADVGATDQDCHGNAPRTRDALLATAAGISGLQGGISGSTSVYTAFDRASNWIIARQSGDGSFGA